MLSHRRRCHPAQCAGRVHVVGLIADLGKGAARMIVDTITVMNICDRIYNKTEWISNPAERELVRAQMIEGVRTALVEVAENREDVVRIINKLQRVNETFKTDFVYEHNN